MMTYKNVLSKLTAWVKSMIGSILSEEKIRSIIQDSYDPYDMTADSLKWLSELDTEHPFDFADSPEYEFISTLLITMFSTKTSKLRLSSKDVTRLFDNFGPQSVLLSATMFYHSLERGILNIPANKSSDQIIDCMADHPRDMEAFETLIQRGYYYSLACVTDNFVQHIIGGFGKPDSKNAEDEDADDEDLEI